MEIEVYSDSDAGPGTLRQAIIDANLNSLTIIKFVSIIKQINLISELIVTSTIEIVPKHKIKITIQNGRHFNVINGNSLKIRNLVLKDGNTILSTEGGGSILVNTVASSSNHNLIIEDSELINNKAQYGGAILTNNNLILIRSKVIKNSALYQGGGCWVGKNATLIDSKINSNEITEISNSVFGGGINVDNGDLTLNSSSISYNKINFNNDSAIGGTAGGVNVTSGNIVLHRSKVNSNIAYSSGGIKMGTGNINILAKSSVSKNKSFISGDDVGGGGITIMKGNVIIDHSKVYENITRGMLSGGIVSFLGNVSINKSYICKNVNRGPGGAIACNFDCCLSIIKSKINDNTGSSIGAAIVNFSNTTGQIYLSDSELKGNKLTNYQTLGQSIAAFLEVITNFTTQTTDMTTTGPSTVSTPTPGSTDVLNIIPIITNLATTTNQALQNLIIPLDVTTLTAGTIAALLECPISIVNSIIENNFLTKSQTFTNPVFTGYAGATFSCNSEVVYDTSIIKENTVIDGATAIYNNKNVIINNSEINNNHSNNKITNNNGTIFNDVSGSVTSIRTLIKNNFIKGAGGGIYNEGNLLLIENKIVDNNTTSTGEGGGVFSTNNFVNCDNIIKNNKPNNIIIN